MSLERPTSPVSGEISHDTDRSRLRKYTRRGLGVLGVGATFVGGGILTTNAFPATGEFYGVKTTLSISPEPTAINSIYDDTLVGGVRANFDHFLKVPGIRVGTEVTKSALQDTTIIKDVQAHPEKYQTEAAEYATEQMLDVTKRFVEGGLLSTGALGAAWLLNRRSDKSWKEKLLTTGGGTMAGVIMLPAMYATYSPDNVQKLSMTGLIADAVNTPDTMRSMSDQRVKNFEPYLNGWLAMGKLAKEKVASPEKQAAGGVNILLVSDIHGANLYANMKQIIDTEGIDAVVDTGDLVNFGTTAEVELSGMTDGIESLGVPYLFVTGNHDSRSPTDRSLLERLAQIPNVHLLQPKTDQYTIVDVRGVRVAGMNDDARWYGDDDNDGDDKQLPYAKKFNQTMKQQQPIDIAVAHQPGAVDAFTVGALRVFGHTHAVKFDKDIISPGTFSGGDPIRNSVSPDGSSNTSSFAVVKYGVDCQPMQLSTYKYSLLNGVPTIDSIAIDAITIPKKTVGDNRVCGSGGVTDFSVTAASK